MSADHATGAERRARLADSRLYVCVDLSRGLPGLLDFAEACFAGGVDILQVRDKAAEARAEVEALRALRPIADRHGALLAANDRADVAVLAGADVLHLGQGDLTTADARSLVGRGMLLGRSTRTRDQVRQALGDPGIDYFCTGPVWETPTKPGRAAVGLELPREAAELRSSARRVGAVMGIDAGPGKPFFAIGGVDLERVPEVLAVGADRIVVVRALTEARDPEAAARALRAAVTAA
ncbi:thiamine phosphate synthase [Brachybacterium hainanense]|uniref:Thiamine-phosphate synthase n=1 Tax=Brachybacterium hainanense TaxID=1541174 RepID=A0ABV6R815_9MICO